MKINRLLNVLFLVFFTNVFVQAQDKKVPLKVGILHFENIISPKKITSSQLGLYNIDSQYDYLERALTDMLYTDIANLSAVELVERAKIEKLLDEIKFDETGLVNEQTAQKLGKAIAGNYLIFGCIEKRKGKILIKSEILDISQQKTIPLEKISENENELFLLQEKLSAVVTTFINSPISQDVAKESQEIEKETSEIQQWSSLAILPFYNNSKTKKLAHLSKGLAEIFSSTIPDLSWFKVVERARNN